MTPFEVVKEGADAFSVCDASTGQVMVVDGSSLSGLTIETAGAYLYALSVLNDVEVAESDLNLRYAIERALKTSPLNSSTHLEDIVVAVRWMAPDVKLSLDVLKALIVKIAAERGKAVI